MGDATIPDSNNSSISFSQLKSAYIAGLGTNSNLNNENNVIKLSFFNGATFTDNTSISISSPVSIKTHFSKKTFGVSKDSS